MRTKSFESNLMSKTRKRLNSIEFYHGSEEFNKPMRSIKDNGINQDVLKKVHHCIND
jgi:hypothetical protein